jgi:hypothetical protein
MTTQNVVFQRHSGPDESTVRIPQQHLMAQVFMFQVDMLAANLEKYSADPGGVKAEYPWATRFVMGHPLATWLRPAVWTEEQQFRFITSVWIGGDLGSYLVNGWYEFDDKGAYLSNSGVLLDGQQRLTALEGYLLGRFGVPDVSGHVRLWSELGDNERRRFLGMTFTQARVHSGDASALRQISDLRAFGGTSHSEDQRAATGSNC